MTPLFVASREDGRSDASVVIDLVADAEPGTLFTFESLTNALEEGTDRTIDHAVVCRAARAARKRLLMVHNRTLRAVPTVGYRLAKAEEHRGIALLHEERGRRQLGQAVETLKHVRWDEMDERNRTAHEAQLTIMAAIWEAIQSVRRTQERHERILRGLIKGVERAG